jgi:hypothetical protein
MGQAAASRAVRTLARCATWELAEVAAYHPMPLPGFLYEEAATLFVAVVDGRRAPAIAAMHGSLLAMRSDGLLVRVSVGGRDLPEVALGLWRSGRVVWHQPFLPWLGGDDVMWLVPAVDEADGQGCPAFPLAARRLRAGLPPWNTEGGRQSGFARAAAALSQGGA